MSRVTFVLLASSVSLASRIGVASAEERWAVFAPQVSGVSEQVAGVFRDLLATEITKGIGGQPVTRLADRCVDATCAVPLARGAGARFVVLSSLSALGARTIAQVSLVDAKSGETTSTQRLTASRVEEIETVATRLAAALTRGTSVEETADVGLLTRAEAKAERRREGARGAALRVGAITPLGGGYAGSAAGLLADISYWFETRHIAIEPRVGARFDSVRDGGRFVEVPIDVAAMFVLGSGDFAPFVGAGAGLRFLWESRLTTVTVGEAIPATATKELEDKTWTFGAFGRVGFLLFRTYGVRLSVSADYNISVTTLNGKKNPQSLTFGVGVIF